MNAKQRRTLERIFATPTPAEVAWNDIEGLLRALGANLTQGAGSRIRITLNDTYAHLHVPHPRRVCTRAMIRGIRDFLIDAGVTP